MKFYLLRKSTYRLDVALCRSRGRIYPALGLLCFLFACSGDDSTSQRMLTLKTIAPHHPMIRYTGRVNFDDPNQPQFSWTGSQVEFAFTGSFAAITLGQVPGSERAAMQQQADYYAVWLDGKPMDSLKVSERRQRFELARNLSDSTHHVKLVKRTEARIGVGTVWQVEIEEGFSLQPLPPAPSLRIGFIGNSITCGYGNLGLSATCSFTPETEDGTQSYAALAAKALDAEMHVIAWSGRGVYRNYDPSRVGLMSQYIEQTLPTDTSATWDHSLWQPHLVVISLGTNDFARGVPPKQAFLNAYEGMVRRLHTVYPTAHILALTGPMLGDQLPVRRRSTLETWLNELQTTLGQEGIDLHRFDMTPQGPLGFGCSYHPNLAQHALNARELVDFIRSEGLDAR